VDHGNFPALLGRNTESSTLRSPVRRRDSTSLIEEKIECPFYKVGRTSTSIFVEQVADREHQVEYIVLVYPNRFFVRWRRSTNEASVASFREIIDVASHWRPAKNAIAASEMRHRSKYFVEQPMAALLLRIVLD